MKKSFAIIALAALVMLASCKKDEQQPTGTKLRAGIEQQKSDSKTSLNPDDLTIKWSEGDELYVNNGYDEGARFTLTSGAGSATGEFTTQGEYYFDYNNNVAVYPYSNVIGFIGTTVQMNLPATQTASAAGTFGNGANPMLGVFSEIDDFTLTSLCGVLCLQLSGDDVNITAIEIVGGLEDKLNGSFKVEDYTATNPALVWMQGGNNTVRLNCEATLTNIAKKFFVVLPAGTLHGFTMNVYNGDNVIFTKSTTNDITFAANYVETMADVTVPTAPAPNPLPSGSYIPSAFSVSPTQQVYFAKGNLRYIGSAGNGDANNTGAYWKFADHQWDVIGTATQFGNTNAQVDRDLFQWGTSGYNHGANRYQPWPSLSTNWNNNFGAGDFYPYGNAQSNLYDGNGSADWGYNALRYSDNPAEVIPENSGWRTLTGGKNTTYNGADFISEWDYVFTYRTTANGQASVVSGTSDARYAKATVNGVPGIILFPDVYTQPTSVSIGNINVANTYWTANVLSQSDFELMEAAGAVFLPVAGYMTGYAGSTDFYYHSSSWDYFPGYSWTLSSNSGYVSVSDPQVYTTSSQPGQVRPNACAYRSNWGAVRLAHNLQ